MTRSIADLIPQFNKNMSLATIVEPLTTTDVSLISERARSESARPISKLEYILLLTIREDWRIQEYSNRSIKELAQLSGHSERGVKAALAKLNKKRLIISQKQTRHHTTVRFITRKGLMHNAVKFRKNYNFGQSAPQSAPQIAGIPYRVSYSSPDPDQTDLSPRDLIFRTLRKEEEAFKALGFSDLDEFVVLTAIKRRQLSQEARLALATTILHAHYKRSIQYKRAYYLAAIENSP